jgi:cellulose synthase/poly-beta-1,6-N-acetylglucosamine synthase-like glycosyltransferase
MRLTVIIPAHNPHPGRLRRTLLGLRAQTLPVTEWETVLVNNASAQFPDEKFFAECAPENFSLVHEPTLGLTAARRRGFGAAGGAFAVLVDDDNVLAPDYLTRTLALFAAHPRVGALGGKSGPEFEESPPAWADEFLGLLALRDLGPAPLISHGLRPPGATRNNYPLFAPLGAGMALRREAWTAWLNTPHDDTMPSDRRGGELTSSGDNDIVLSLMQAGWEVAYFPELSLVHLIPAARLDPGYLARLNRGIQKSWMQVLAAHDASPWPPLTPFGAALRKAKAWFVHRAWRSSAARIRWQGACGHFEGRVCT